MTGGCGYIGSHTIVDLIEAGHDVVCLDGLINASDTVLQGIMDITGREIENHRVDLTDKAAVHAFFQSAGSIDGIIHFAALKAVGESVQKPLLYFHNNVTGMINLLDAAVACDVKLFVFSSSCTVYGSPETLPVGESAPFQKAQSPYGRTKQIGEGLLEVVSNLSGLRCISLRYFNPAGAHPSARIGESPINPALNLVPIITETAYGLRNELKVFGDDYETRDGTCIRDYIHVCDLARAHTMAVEYLTAHPDLRLDVFNLGTGHGVSVLEALSAFESANQLKVPFSIAPRRPGDVAAIYAENGKAAKVLNWEVKFTMEDIMKTAWAWEQVRRN